MSDSKLKADMNRRDFLRSSAAVGAGFVLASTVSGLAGDSKNSDDINVAIIGAGAQGRILVESAVKIPGVRFKALCDIWTSYNQTYLSNVLKVAYQQEHNRYVDYKEMLAAEKDIDAVLIATPDFWHSEQAVTCLEAGLDVYCEKEMSNTLEGARKMVEAAKRTGKLLQIGHQRRSNPRYLYCYERILKKANLLGRITTINGQWNRSKEACMDRDVAKKYYIEPAVLEKYGFKSMHQFLNWRWFKGLGGGPIIDLGSHQIDIYSWFLGTNPVSAIASGGTDYYDKSTHEWFDNVMVVYEYQTQNGIVRGFYQTGTTNSSNGYYECFMGDEGTLVISEASNRGSVYRENWVPAEKWEKWIAKGVLYKQTEQELKCLEDAKKQCRLAFGAELMTPRGGGGIVDVRESPVPPKYDLPITMDKPYHQPHLENFFNAVRRKEQLNCPAEVGYETAVAVLKVNESIAGGKKINFSPEEFKVV